MTRSTFSLRSAGWILGAVVSLALVVGVVAMPTDAVACTQGCVTRTIHPDWDVCFGSAGSEACLFCTFCY